MLPCITPRNTPLPLFITVATWAGNYKISLFLERKQDERLENVFISLTCCAPGLCEDSPRPTRLDIMVALLWGSCTPHDRIIPRILECHSPWWRIRLPFWPSRKIYIMNIYIQKKRMIQIKLKNDTKSSQDYWIILKNSVLLVVNHSETIHSFIHSTIA